MSATTSPLPSREDLLLWPDGTWCYREELGKAKRKGPGYRVILIGTALWHQLHQPKSIK